MRVAAELKRRNEEALCNYVPNDEPNHNQLAYHKSPAKFRIGCGGTGSGKTVVTMMELGAAVTGQHFWWMATQKDGSPIYKKPPVHAWVIKQSFPTNPHTDAVVMKLLRGDFYTDPETQQEIHHPPIIPPRFNPKFNGKNNTITLNNGSTIEIKSAEQKPDKLASVGIDIIVVDEPIPPSHWEEAKMRCIRRQGSRFMFNLTPWSLQTDYLYEMLNDEKGKYDVQTFEFWTTENKYLSRANLDAILSMIPESDWETRVQGKPRQFTGLTYAEWDNWVKLFPIPDDWTRYAVHDPGISNPAATLWCAVEPGTDNIYLYKCLYDERRTASIKACVDLILETNAGDKVHKWLIDPFAASMRAPTLEDPKNEKTMQQMYRHCGLPVVLGPRQQEQAGREQRIHCTRLYIDKGSAYPNIYAFDTEEMEPFRRELNLYRMARNKESEDKNEPDEPHRKHDHLMYCMETMCSIKLKNVMYNAQRRLPTFEEQALHGIDKLWEGEKWSPMATQMS